MGMVWGMAGILAASLIAMLVTYLWYEPIVLYKDCFGISAKVYFLERLYEIAALAAAIIVLGFFSNQWIADSWIAWIMKGCVLFAVVNLYCLLLFHRNAGFKELMNRIKERFNR